MTNMRKERLEEREKKEADGRKQKVGRQPADRKIGAYKRVYR